MFSPRVRSGMLFVLRKRAVPIVANVFDVVSIRFASLFCKWVALNDAGCTNRHLPVPIAAHIFDVIECVLMVVMSTMRRRSFASKSSSANFCAYAKRCS